MVWLWLLTSLAVYVSVSGGSYKQLASAHKQGEFVPGLGTYVGSFSTLHHKVSGDVYAVDEVTMKVINFNYDGAAPDAYFFAGNQEYKPSNKGFPFNHKGCKSASKCRDPDPLGPCNNRNFTIQFPFTKRQRSFNNIKWISVWCKKFAVDFGNILIPDNIGAIIPKAVPLGPLVGQSNSVYAANVVMEDEKTISFEDLIIDKSVKDAVIVVGANDKREYALVEDRKSYKSAFDKSLRLKVPRNADGKRLSYIAVVSPSRGMLSQMKIPSNMRLPPAV